MQLNLQNEVLREKYYILLTFRLMWRLHHIEICLYDDKLRCWLSSSKYVFLADSFKQIFVFETFGLKAKRKRERECARLCGTWARLPSVATCCTKGELWSVLDILWVMAISIISAYFNFCFMAVARGNIFTKLYSRWRSRVHLVMCWFSHAWALQWSFQTLSVHEKTAL